MSIRSSLLRLGYYSIAPDSDEEAALAKTLIEAEEKLVGEGANDPKNHCALASRLQSHLPIFEHTGPPRSSHFLYSSATQITPQYHTQWVLLFNDTSITLY
jgi:hypothetical protein